MADILSIEQLLEAIMDDDGCLGTVIDMPPPDGNPYSDLPLLGVPAANPCRDVQSRGSLREVQRRAIERIKSQLGGKPPAQAGPDLDIHEREAIVESVRQQYGEHAAQAEAARLKVLCRERPFPGAAATSPTATTRPMSMEYSLSAPPDAGAVERSIYATLEEIGYPCAEEGRPGRLSVAARLAEEVAGAGELVIDGRPVIGRLQALHNLGWLLRRKFPAEKIDARKIARIGNAT
jgi:hypothetical protein